MKETVSITINGVPFTIPAITSADWYAMYNLYRTKVALPEFNCDANNRWESSLQDSDIAKFKN